MRRRVLPGSRALERVSAAMAVRLALQPENARPTLFILVPSASDAIARQIAIGLLLGDLAHSSLALVAHLPANERCHLLRGDLLLVTPSVTTARLELERSRLIDGRAIGDLWSVQPFSRHTPGRTGKPRAFVANPGWVVGDRCRDGIGAAIIDASHPRTHTRLRELLGGPIGRCPTRIVVAPPLTVRTLAALGFPGQAKAWMWDPRAQLDVEELLSGKPTPATEPPPVRRQWLCDDDEVDRSLSEVHERLSDALRHSGERAFPGLHQAWAIYHRLRLLSVPLAQLEERSAHAWSGSIKRRLDQLATVEGAGNPAWETKWPGIRSGVGAVYRLLLSRSEPPKFWVLASRLDECLRAARGDQHYRVVVSTEQEVELLGELLAEVLDGFRLARAEGRVEVTSARQEEWLVAAQQNARTLLAGVRSSRTRYLDVYPRCDVEAILYPFEAQIDAAVLAGLYEFSHQLQGAPLRGQALSALGFSDGGRAVESQPTPAPALYCQQGTGRIAPIALEPQVRVRIDLDELAGDASVEHPQRAEGSHSPFEAQLDVGTALVQYHGHSIRYPADHRVDVFFEETDQLRRERVCDLRKGWKVVVFVDGPYDDLFKRLGDAVDQQVSRQEQVALELWRQAKARMLLRFDGDRTALHADLARAGLTSDYATVAAWFRELDQVLAPQGQEDFLVVAKQSGAYPNESLMLETFAHIKRHRGRQRVEGRYLKGLLRAILIGREYEEALESIRAFDARVADVMAAVDLWVVQGVRLPPSP